MQIIISKFKIYKYIIIFNYYIILYNYLKNIKYLIEKHVLKIRLKLHV